MTRARDLAAFVSNADGDIKFDTDTLFIDSSANRVGIGTTTPDGILDITGSGNTDVYINTGNNSGDNSRIFFGDTADIDVGYLAYDHGTNKMVFGVNAGNRMFIDNSGDVHIADNANGPDAALHIEKTTPQVRLQLNGNSGYNTIESGGSNELIIGRSGTEQLRVLSGGGLTFNGDTAAANALDDYEEGTGTFGVVQGTMSGNAYTYTKIGRLCYIQSVISGWSDTSSGNSLELTGLPFTAGVTGNAVGSSMANLNSSGKHILYINSSNRVLFYASNIGSGYDNLKHSELPSTGSIHLFLTYQTT